MNWLTRALDLYEKASTLAPDEPAYRWRLVDLYLNTSRAEKMLAELHYLAEHLPADKLTQDWYRAYKQAYDEASGTTRPGGDGCGVKQSRGASCK
jgi:predicted Zn-dependent protease